MSAESPTARSANLSRAELLELHRRVAATRDQEARSLLVEAYEGFARALANRFRGGREAVEDVNQAALLGLLHSIDRYDPDRGVEFTTFAWTTIVGEIKRHFRDRSWSVRVPRRLQELYLQAAAAVDDLSVELHRAPTIAELAEHIGVDEERVIEALEVRGAHRMGSLDAPTEEGEPARDLGGLDTNLARAETRQVLAPLLDRLPDRERRIVELRFVSDMTQSEIAAEVGLSQMHVSRLLTRTLTQLREWAVEQTTN